MTKVTRKVTETITEYVSNDGKEFSTEDACLYHEWCLTATALWVVHHRGGRSSEVDIFTTKEDAKIDIGNATGYVITKIYANERIWRTRPNKKGK